MKKISLVLALALVFVLVLPVAAADEGETKVEFSGKSEFKFKDGTVSSNDGYYVKIDDVFDSPEDNDRLQAREDNEFYNELELGMDVIHKQGDNTYKVDLKFANPSTANNYTYMRESFNGTDDFLLLELDKYEVVAEKGENFTATFTNKLNPKFNKYVLPQNLDGDSSEDDDRKNGDLEPYTEGVLTETSLAGLLKVKGVLFQESYNQDEDPEDMIFPDVTDYPVNDSGNLYVYGLEVTSNPLEALTVGTTFIRTKDQQEDIGHREKFDESRSKNNFAVNTKYDLADFLPVEKAAINLDAGYTTWGKEAKNYDEEDNIEEGMLLVTGLEVTPLTGLNTSLMYKNVEKGYSPVRRIEEPKEGSKVQKIVKKDPEDYARVETVPNEKGFAVETSYELPVLPFSTAIKADFEKFEHTRDKNGEEKQKAEVELTAEQEGLFSVSTSYELENIKDNKKKDDKTDTLEVYGEYKVLNTYPQADNGAQAGNYSVKLTGGYENIVEENYRGIKTTEDIMTVGLNTAYNLVADLKLKAGYAVEKRDYTKDKDYSAMLNVASTGLEYKVMDGTDLKIDYRYNDYKGDEIAKYYDENFATNEVTAELEVKF